MSNSAAVAVTVREGALRYVDLQRRGETTHLRRAGRRRVAEGVRGALLGQGQNDAPLMSLSDTLAAALDGSEAEAGRFIVHPTDARSFVAPVDAEMSDEGRTRALRRQAALVTGARSADALHLVPTTVRTEEVEGGSVEWVHMLVLPQTAPNRLRQITEALSVGTWEWVLSSMAARYAMADPSDTGELTGGTYALLVGQYDTHAELALTEGRTWWHASHVQDKAPANLAYFAAGLLNRVSIAPDAVEALRVFGDAVDLDACAPLSTLFGTTPTRIDPFHDIKESTDLGTAARSALVPSIGAARAALQS